MDNEIGDIARAAEVFRRTLVDADAAREAAVRALAEQRLAEESYRKLFEGSVDGIYVTTPGGRLLNANPALARMMGYDTPEGLIGGVNDIARTVYVDPGLRGEYQARMQRDGMVREFEYQVRQRDGGILWLSDSATSVRDETGQVVRYEGTVRDITDQKRAEDAIAEGRRMLQEVIDTVPAVINVKDKQLRYVLMNRYMAGIFGIEPSDAIGRTTTDLMSRYGAQKTDENDKRVLVKGSELGFYEEEYINSAGNMRQWLVNKLPLLDAKGEIENIVTVALDIGERKRGELEMRKAKDAAESALRNLRETQNSLIEAEKLAALGRLVAGVAHEVNNPVGISLTVASSLERKTALFASEVARGNLKRSSLNDFLETSRDASSQLVANLNRAAELIQSFKQVAADRNYSDQRAFDLGDLTEQVVMSLRPGLRKHNLTLNVECQPNLTDEQLPRALRPGAHQPVPQFRRARVSERQGRHRRHQGAGVRQGQCRNSVFRQWNRHEPRRQAAGVRSVLHHPARSGRHRARPAYRLQHRHQSSGRAARPGFPARRWHPDSDHSAAGGADRAGGGIDGKRRPCRGRIDV